MSLSDVLDIFIQDDDYKKEISKSIIYHIGYAPNSKLNPLEDTIDITQVQFANAGGLDTNGLDEEDLKELQRQIDYIKKMKNKGGK